VLPPVIPANQARYPRLSPIPIIVNPETSRVDDSAAVSGWMCLTYLGLNACPKARLISSSGLDMNTFAFGQHRVSNKVEKILTVSARWSLHFLSRLQEGGYSVWKCMLSEYAVGEREEARAGGSTEEGESSCAFFHSFYATRSS
jgi:hypothetical protein